MVCYCFGKQRRVWRCKGKIYFKTHVTSENNSFYRTIFAGSSMYVYCIAYTEYCSYLAPHINVQNGLYNCLLSLIRRLLSIIGSWLFHFTYIIDSSNIVPWTALDPYFSGRMNWPTYSVTALLLIQDIYFFKEKIMDGYEFKKHIDRAAELNPRYGYDLLKILCLFKWTHFSDSLLERPYIQRLMSSLNSLGKYNW